MVTINGIQLKNVKEFGGMEGNGFNATVYMDGKKIGTVEDQGFGSGMDFNINQNYQNEFDKRAEYKGANEYNFDEQTLKSIGKETMVSKILDLVVIEKAYKKAAKKYSNAVIVAVYNKGSYLGKYYLVAPGKVNEVIATEKGNECKIFGKLEDFNL